jgi:(p)ppGpp synthase/HD superfamily hydrolase
MDDLKQKFEELARNSINMTYKEMESSAIQIIANAIDEDIFNDIISTFLSPYREKAAKLHSDRNLLYADKPYVYHLDMVAQYGIKYKELIPVDEFISVMIAIYGHDTIEDCAITYNDAVELFGHESADIIYDVTNELGKNRKERALKTYPKISNNPLAQFVKLCDRLANMQESLNTNSSMFKKYKQELPTLKSSFQKHEGYDFTQMWNELESL